MCGDLHARGVPGPGRSGKWARGHVQKMLTDPVYAGVFQWPKVRQGKYVVPTRGGVSDVEGGDDRRTYAVVEGGDRIVIEDNHEAVVTPAEQARVVEALSSRRWKRTTPRRGGGEWVLSGVAKCASCGGSIIGRTERHKERGRVFTYRYLLCGARHRFGVGACSARKQIQQDRLVRSLVADLPGWFKEGDRLGELRSAIESRRAAEDVRADAERVRLAGAVAEADAWLARAAVNVLEVAADIRPAAERAIRERVAARDADASRLAALDAEAHQGQASRAEFAEALAALEKITDHIANAPPALVRRLLSALVEKVTLRLDQDEVTAEVTFRPEVTSTTSYVFPVGRSRRR